MTNSPLLRLKDRLDELDKMIDEAPGWGAYVSVLIEERDAIAGQIDLPPRRLVDGVPLAD